MSTISPISAGMQPLSTAYSQIQRSGKEIAASTTSGSSGTSSGANGASASSLTESLVGQQEAQTYALAGVKVVQAADEVIGTILDVSA